MLISELRNYIKKEGSVSMTDLNLKFELEKDQLQIPLDILINKGYIEVTLPEPEDSPGKCIGCPMGCKKKEQDDCSPAPLFHIYRWIKS